MDTLIPPAANSVVVAVPEFSVPGPLMLPVPVAVPTVLSLAVSVIAPLFVLTPLPNPKVILPPACAMNPAFAAVRATVPFAPAANVMLFCACKVTVAFSPVRNDGRMLLVAAGSSENA